MNIKFRGLTAWELHDDRIIYGSENKIVMLDEMTDFICSREPNRGRNGQMNVYIGRKRYILEVAYSQITEFCVAKEYLCNKLKEARVVQQAREAVAESAKIARELKESANLIYDLCGVRGRHMKVYENKVIIRTDVGLGSFITGNISDGEKTIYYKDCIGVQFKASGFQIGYLQLETASGLMNNKSSNFFNENSFTFDPTVQSNEKMREVADYIIDKVEEVKNNDGKPVAGAISAADEIKKYKELLDMGVITQEEFDAKKRQLLGL